MTTNAYLTRRRLRHLKAAYGVDSDAFRAEMMGSAIIRNHSFIANEHINLLKNAEKTVVLTEDMLRTPPHYVYVSIDPSGSTRSKVDGETSDYAFVTAFVHNGAFVVQAIHRFYLHRARPSAATARRSGRRRGSHP